MSTKNTLFSCRVPSINSCKMTSSSVKTPYLLVCARFCASDRPRFCSSSVSTSLVCRSKYQLKLVPTARTIRLIKAIALTFSDTRLGLVLPVGVEGVSMRSSPVSLAVHFVGRLNNLRREGEANLGCRLEVDVRIDVSRSHEIGVCLYEWVDLDVGSEMT